MSGSHRDRRNHRRKVGGTAKGLKEHQTRDKRRKRKAKVEKTMGKPMGKTE